MTSPQTPPPTPERIFGTLNAYQQSAALKAAIDLDLFTAIAEGKQTPADLASRCDASERGVRILCDYLTVLGFLTKSGGRYGLSPDAAAFLDRNSPAFMGSAAEFLVQPVMLGNASDLTACVRKGGTTMPGKGSVEDDHPMWQTFARAMAPLMRMSAQGMVETIKLDTGRKLKALDTAAGHGVFGITFAQAYPNLEVTALDWPKVLEVAHENAVSAGVSDRHHLLPGSAFETDFGEGYDLVLLTNFLHHFDPATNISLLKKVRASLNEGGKVATLEFVPNPDRVTPPIPAAFSLIMLMGTPSGDAYTFPEYQEMFEAAGFTRNELKSLAYSPSSVIISS
jgi:ubiquinone/menaquinone biosynthesis C-methylase UbiE